MTKKNDAPPLAKELKLLNRIVSDITKLGGPELDWLYYRFAEDYRKRKEVK